MISYQAVLVELEKHIQAAKVASTEQQFREALVATKALCDVVLQLSTNEQQTSSFKANDKVVTSTTTVTTDVMSQQFASLQRLEEEDGANGASLFDF